MTEIEKLPLTSMDLKEHQLLKLKELFPEVFTEGLKVDWEKLKLTVGEDIDVGKERFGMNWAGKADCYKTIQQPSVATLIPVREESVDFDITENLFIEGDNLEVLKLLQKSYLGKVKMIYIDPPYNTGNDFIYPDNYSENLDTYLQYTGQIDSDGRKFSTNTDTDGRFHSKWMNMMYPRLFLAKNLLREDGIIFISIGDSEEQNLKAICNEIYGEENHIGTFVWQSKKGGGSDSRTVVNDHEYVLAYAKLYPEKGLAKILLESEALDQIDDIGPYRVGRELNKWGSNSRREDRPTMWFPIAGPLGEEVYPIRNDGSEGCWRYGKANMIKFVEDQNILFVKRSNGTYVAFEKIRTTEPRQKPFRTWLNEISSTAEGSKVVKNLFDDKKVFDFPKPIDLLKHLISIGCSDTDDIVLDFFAGSCSTAQAIIESNILSEEKSLKFICIQLPQETEIDSEAYKLGYKTIAEIGKERIRKVINKNLKEHNENTDIFKRKISDIDLGFKVFKLAQSNFKVWNSMLNKELEAIQTSLEIHTEHIEPKATQDAILFELLLKSGFALTTPIIQLTLESKQVFSIADGELLICLEDELTHDLLKAIAELKPSRVICLDKSFKSENADALKTNAVQIMKSKGVVNFRTV